MAKNTKTKELNLLTALDRVGQKKKTGKGRAIIATFVLICCAVTALFLMYSIRTTDELTERLNVAQSYTSNPAIVAQYTEAMAKADDSSTIEKDASSVDGALIAIASYPDMTKEKFEKLFDIAGKDVGMSNISFDRDSGILNFSAKCDSAALVPIFISDLRSSGMFSDISYDGYAGATYQTSGKPKKTESGELAATQVTSTEFSFNVTCVVSADVTAVTGNQ